MPEVLVTRLEDKFLNHVMTCNTAKEMWDKLKSIFEHQSQISVHLLQKKFFSMEYKDCTVADFVSQLEDIRTQLKNLGEELGEKMVITKIIMSLPESLKHIISAWESTPTDRQTLSELTSRLLVEEERVKQSEQTNAFVVKQSQHNLQGHLWNKTGHYV